MFLITSANGNQGELLVPKLLAKNRAVRALVRTEASGAYLRGLGVDVIVGDMGEPGLLERAMQGVTSVYHIGPVLDPHERQIGMAAIDAARTAGVRHFVYSSVLHAIITDLVQHEIKRDIEEYLLASGLEFTILQPANYMFPLKLIPAFRDHVFKLSWSLDRLQSMVDLDDITDVAFDVLTDGARHYGATYELVGRGRYNAYQLGDIISDVIGKPVRVEEIDPDLYLKAQIGDRDPAAFAHLQKVLHAMSARYSAHDFVGNPNVLTWLLGREPTSFAQFVERHYSLYLAEQRATGSQPVSAAKRTAEMAGIADIHTPLLHDHWYVAGHADEFDEGLHERMFLDHSIVIFRTASGELTALQNRCAHRSFPLAHGWLEQDGIRCRYHGARYDATGRLAEVPSMKACPRVQIRSYPMAVAGPLAWIWMGDPDHIGPLPDTSWLGEGWRFVHGSYLFTANWLLMAENLMDLTHVPFLHETSLSMSRQFAELQIKMETRPDSLTFYRDNPAGYEQSPFLPGEIRAQLKRTGFDARSSVDFVSPALTVGGGTFRPKRLDGHEQPVYRFEIAHFITPKSQRETYYWYFHARNYCLDDEQLSDKIKATVVAAFQEDKFAIEHVQRMHEEDAPPFRETHFKSDGPAVEMRRMIARLAAKERRPA